jgi:hypothetical protein
MKEVSGIQAELERPQAAEKMPTMILSRLLVAGDQQTK